MAQFSIVTFEMFYSAHGKRNLNIAAKESEQTVFAHTLIKSKYCDSGVWANSVCSDFNEILILRQRSLSK